MAERRSSGWIFTGRPAFGLGFLAPRHSIVSVELTGVLVVREPNTISTPARNLFYLTGGSGITHRFSADRRTFIEPGGEPSEKRRPALDDPERGE